MRRFFISILCLITLSSYSSDYQKSIDVIKSYQEKYSDGDEISYIFELAKSDSHPDIVSHAMTIFALHKASKGDTKTFLAAYQSAINRFPNSEAIRYLKTLPLLPDPCSSCSGTGLVDQQQNKACSTCNATGRCKRCNGTGQTERLGFNSSRRTGSKSFTESVGPNGSSSTKSFDMRCLTCGGSGKCGSCGGAPVREFSVKVTCPQCKGITKEVNTNVAKDGLIRMTQALRDVLVLALGCESAYASALESQDPVQKLEAVKNCLSKYGQAINVAMVKECVQELTVKAEAFQRQQKEQKKKDEEQRLKDEAEKQALGQQHEALLYTIESVKTPTVALKGIKEFIENNPKSPVIAKARLLRSEIEARIEAEKEASTRRFYYALGGGVIFVIGFLSWLASCIKFK